MKNLTQYLNESLKDTFPDNLMTNYQRFIQLTREDNGYGRVNLITDNNIFKEFKINKDKYNCYVIDFLMLTELFKRFLHDCYPIAFNADYDLMSVGNIGQIYIYIFINKENTNDIGLSVECEGSADFDKLTKAFVEFYLPILQNMPKNPSKTDFENLTGGLINAFQYYFTRTDLNDSNSRIYKDFIKYYKYIKKYFS